MKNKRGQMSVQTLISVIIVLLVVVLSILLITQNNPFGFLKYLPTFNENDKNDNFQSNNADEIYQQAKDNRAEINNYNCKVEKEGYCLNENDWLKLTASRPKAINIEKCKIGNYCFWEDLGCFSSANYEEKYLCMKFLEKDYEMVDSCDNIDGTSLNSNPCACINQESYKFLFYENEILFEHLTSYPYDQEDKKDYINQLIKNINEDSDAPSTSSLINELGSNPKKIILENLEVCNETQYCIYGYGCVEEKSNKAREVPSREETEEKESSFKKTIKKIWDGISFWN